MSRLPVFALLLGLAFGCQSTSEQRYQRHDQPGTGSGTQSTPPPGSTGSSTGSQDRSTQRQTPGSSESTTGQSSGQQSYGSQSTGGSTQLAGTRWNIRLTPAGTSTGSQGNVTEDTLVFEGNQLRVSGGSRQGFPAASYTSTRQGEGTTFRAEQRSPDQGTLMWNGTVQGDTIRGTATLMKPDGSMQNFRFEGKKTQ